MAGLLDATTSVWKTDTVALPIPGIDRAAILKVRTMHTPLSVPGHWGPGCHLAAVSITFDNLGEALELERGTWTGETPLGQHLSVTRVLPVILQMLQELHLSATFFIEGLNAEMYPQALQNIVEASHEVGYHAWRHEEWKSLSPEEEAHNLEHGLQAFSKLDIRPYGFRPPGGQLTEASTDLLKQTGFLYCSPAGEKVTRSHELVVLPFAWPIVDAYAYLPSFSQLRQHYGATAAPLSPEQYRASLHSSLEKAIQEHEYLSLLFHPFVEETEAYFAVMYATLQELRGLIENQSIWCVPCRTVAQWVQEHPDDPDLLR